MTAANCQASKLAVLTIRWVFFYARIWVFYWCEHGGTSDAGYKFFHLWKTCSSTWFSASLVIHSYFALRVRVSYHSNFSFSSKFKDSSSSHRAQILTKIDKGNDIDIILIFKKYEDHPLLFQLTMFSFVQSNSVYVL